MSEHTESSARDSEARGASDPGARSWSEDSDGASRPRDAGRRIGKRMSHRPKTPRRLMRLWASLGLLIPLLALASCSDTTDSGQANVDATATDTTTAASTAPSPAAPTPTATRARPTPTATIAVIDSSTVAAWSNPTFNQPTATSFKATSVSNGVGTYSIPVNVTFVPKPYQNDPRFKPPVISLVFEYTDPIKGTDVRVLLVSNQTKTVTFSEKCPANGGAGALDGAAAVYVQDANGIEWKDLGATTPQNVRNTPLHLDLTCP